MHAVSARCKEHEIDACVHRHLDADEAVVRGAALYAANLSTTFRLNRKFGMTDGVVYPVSFKVTPRHLYIWRSRLYHS